MAIEESVVIGLICSWALGIVTPGLLKLALRIGGYSRNEKTKKKEEDHAKS